jgi:hypothetical protein
VQISQKASVNANFVWHIFLPTHTLPDEFLLSDSSLPVDL